MILRPLAVTFLFGLLFVCAILPAQADVEAASPPLADATMPAQPRPEFEGSGPSAGRVPLSFVAASQENTFYLQGSSTVHRFDRTGSTYPLAGGEIAPRREFVGSSAQRSLTGEEALPGTTNWLMGDDPLGWRVDQPNYAGLRYRELYPGVDLSIDTRSRPDFLRQHFTLRPGSDPSTIRWRYPDLAAGVGEDAQTLTLAQEPALGAALESDLRGWQDVGGQEVAVAVRYTSDVASDASGAFFFGLDGYNPAYPLFIESYIPVADQPIETQADQNAAADDWDPLTFTTLFGGNRHDWVTAIAVDMAGNVYVAGASTSDNFPQVGSYPFSRNCNERYSVGVIFKLNPDATQVLYSTYFGGGCNDTVFDIEVDAQGRIFVAGFTSSPNFPTAGAPLTPSADGAEPCITEIGPTKGFLCRAESFVAWFDKDGKTLIFSSFFGGDESDIATSLAVDDSTLFFGGATGSESLTGGGDRYAIGAGGGVDGFVARVSLETQQLLSVTRIGGDKTDGVEGLALGPNGELFLNGNTQSTHFPTLNPAFGSLSGETDSFVMRMDPTGATMGFASYFGGALGDHSLGIDVDGAGNAYIAGYTYSDDVPTTPNVLAPVAPPSAGSNGYSSFVASFTLTGTLRYATYLGGSGNDAVQNIVVDARGIAYVVGHTTSVDFPTVNPVQAVYGGSRDGFLSRINRDGTELLFSTYLGGSDNDSAVVLATDNKSNIYLAGSTNGAIPTTPDVMQPSPPACAEDTSCSNIYVTRLNFLPWTYLIYSAFDNDLSTMEYWRIKTLERFVADNPYVQIAVLLDYDSPDDDPSYTDSTYYVVKQKNITVWPAFYETDVTVFPHAELDTADPQTLVDFVTWAKKRYPSRHVALVMDSHGTGVTGAMYDEDTGNSAPKRGMTIQEIGQALDTITNGGQDKIDLLYMVACLMGMVEPAYEWRTSVDYYLSSEQIYISDGGTNLALSANIITDTIKPKLLAERTADAYAETHIAGVPPHGPAPYSISVADLSQMEPLHGAVHIFADAIAEHLRDSPDSWLTFSQIISDVQHFDSNGNLKVDDDDEYIDLYHFALLINTRIPDTNLQAAAQAVMDRFQDYIIYNRAGRGERSGNYWDHSNAYGAAIFLPKTPRSFYERFKLSFLQSPPASIGRNISEPESGWKGFHNSYVALSNPDAADNPTPPSLISPKIIGSVQKPNRHIYLPTVQR